MTWELGGHIKDTALLHSVHNIQNIYNKNNNSKNNNYNQPYIKEKKSLYFCPNKRPFPRVAITQIQMYKMQKRYS